MGLNDLREALGPACDLPDRDLGMGPPREPINADSALHVIIHDSDGSCKYSSDSVGVKLL